MGQPKDRAGAGGAAKTKPTFFGCYLIGSRNPAMKGRSYVVHPTPYTLNPEP